MAALKANWHQLGPMPTDSTLDEKLSRVKHENNHAESEERVWMEFGRANADLYADAEREFFTQLDNQVKSL
ncbi:hypothetical protein [Mesorhizobium sp.]|uniref:hypothetical protein n=1 Tax=Mesorhizobium sp. TaxID=1871066 RepID=UPI000FE345E9|nr:hypothetical protein [Mesorhizobium sp.]RWQ16067.1 MAG: hypothetical protein EOR92_22570 [Mesorhizobium sp.]